jgi:6-phosphogluconolactonase
MATPQLHVVSAGDIQDIVCDRVVEYASKCILDRGLFTIGVSGGSVAKYLTQGLGARAPSVDWTKWRIFFCDERLVPFDDGESTYGYFKRELFDRVNFPPSNVLAIDSSLTVEKAAEDYVQKIKGVFKTDETPSFDLLILGMGPDGHTCSLFPGHPGLDEKDKLVIPISDSPKPPPMRITLTFPVLNKARNVFVVATGAGKAIAVKDSLEPADGNPLPVGRVKPTNGELHWFMDDGAAGNLSKK